MDPCVHVSGQERLYNLIYDFKLSGIFGYLMHSIANFSLSILYYARRFLRLDDKLYKPCLPLSVAILPQIHEWSNSVE